MAFAPTPPRSFLPAQLLPLSSITSTMIQQSGGPSGSVTITSPPTGGVAATALSLVGTVAPSATAVQVGLSSSASTPPPSWVAATVSGTAWAASVTPSAAGTYYIWAEQTAASAVRAVSAAVVVSAAVGSVALTSPPAAGNTSTALALLGTVSPSGAAVRVGLSTSATVAPANWTNATVSGSGWTASLSATTAGTYFIWAQQTSNTVVQSVSAAVIITAAGAAQLYSLISGSGNASLTGTTLITTTAGSAPAVDWTTTIAHGSTDVAPNVTLSTIGSITAAKFWFDTTNTGVTPGTFGNALFSGSLVSFYPFVDAFGTPICAPAAPATAGTYYGKYAFYNSAAVLLGVFTTGAIIVT